jgi:hypothetical protein
MKRPARGALLTVSIGDTEAAEWQTDAEFRAALLKDITRRTRDKGRKFFEIIDPKGKALHVGEISR